MKRTNNTEKNFLGLLKDYLNIYQNMYPKEAVEYINENIEEMIFETYKTDLIAQIYAELGVLPDNENYYLGFAKMIGEKYGWDLNILEIGCGFFPILSKYIDLKQQELGIGTITAFDSCLITESLGNIKLYKEDFVESMNVSDYDLIVGIMACDATELIIRKAIISKKDFFVALCGCTHFPENRSFSHGPYSFNYTTEDYHDRVFEIASEHKSNGFDIKVEMSESFQYKYPIVSSRRI